MTKTLTTGDLVPWFDAQTLANTTHNLSVMAGRWVVLFFAHDLADETVTRTLADIIVTLGRAFTDDHMVCYAVLTAPTPMDAQLAAASHRGLGFIKDYDGAITRQCGADAAPKLMVIDPMLRVERVFALGGQGAGAPEICGYLAKLPKTDDFAGVPLVAPVLVIPHVFEPEFCEELIKLYQENGGKDSGFMLDKDGKTMTVIDHSMKQRQDFVLYDPVIRSEIRKRITRRVVPMMERFFQYRPTRMDRYLVSCYDSETGGHFSRHRDNVNVGARHRVFAASFNLNADYEGCKIFFPEFGQKQYAAPHGGAVVFSTGALHQVTPVTKGKRYAFVPFFYGEAEAALRLQNNAHLHDDEGRYTNEDDRLTD